MKHLNCSLLNAFDVWILLIWSALSFHDSAMPSLLVKKNSTASRMPITNLGLQRKLLSSLLH